MYQEVPYRFPDIYLETRNLENGNRALVASRLGSEEKQKERLKFQMEAELQDLETAIGFSHIIRIISKSVCKISLIIFLDKVKISIYN